MTIGNVLRRPRRGAASSAGSSFDLFAAYVLRWRSGAQAYGWQPVSSATMRARHRTSGWRDQFVTLGESFRVEVRSVETGSVVHTLGKAAGAIAVSPDGSTVFYQGEGQFPAFPIYAVPIQGGEPTVVAAGSAPVASPDSSRLAFLRPSSVGIYDIERQITSTIDLTGKLPANTSLANTGSLLAWVTNTRLLAVPLGHAVMASGPNRTGRPRPSPATGQVAVVIDLDTRAVRATSLPAGAAVALAKAVPTGEPGDVVVGCLSSAYFLRVTPEAITLLDTPTVPGSWSLITALSPDASKLLYLTKGGLGTPPPTTDHPTPPKGVYVDPGTQLWEASIGRSITPTRLLIDDARLHGAAW